MEQQRIPALVVAPLDIKHSRAANSGNPEGPAIQASLWRRLERIFGRAIPKETPNKVGGGGGLATEAYLLTAACLEAVWVGGNRGCIEVLLSCFRD